MSNLTQTLQSQPLAVAALAIGSYLALGRARNIQLKQGCFKCEAAQLGAAVALVAFAGYTLAAAAKNGGLSNG